MPTTSRTRPHTPDRRDPVQGPAWTPLPGRVIDLITDGVTLSALRRSGNRAVFGALVQTAMSAQQRGWGRFEWEDLLRDHRRKLLSQLWGKPGRPADAKRVKRALDDAWERGWEHRTSEPTWSGDRVAEEVRGAAAALIAALEDSSIDLSDADRLILRFVAAEFVRRGYQQVALPRRAVVEATGLGERSVRNGLDRLEKAGWITLAVAGRSGHRRRANLYSAGPSVGVSAPSALTAPPMEPPHRKREKCPRACIGRSLRRSRARTPSPMRRRRHADAGKLRCGTAATPVATQSDRALVTPMAHPADEQHMYWNHAQHNDDVHQSRPTWKELPSVHSRLDHEEAGFSSEAASEWHALGVTPSEALAFQHLGVGPADVALMKVHPVVCGGWIAAGFSPEAATPWVREGFSPEEAEVWRRGRWSPSEARTLCDLHDEAAGAAILWALTPFSPADALSRAESLESPLPHVQTSADRAGWDLDGTDPLLPSED